MISNEGAVQISNSIIIARKSANRLIKSIKVNEDNQSAILTMLSTYKVWLPGLACQGLEEV